MLLVTVTTSDWSYSCWIYFPSLPGTDQGIFGNWGSVPYFYLQLESGNKAQAGVNFAGANIFATSTAAITGATWTNIIVNHDRSGNMTLYVGGVTQADAEDISAHVAVSMTNNSNFNLGNVGNQLSGYYSTMTLDDVYIWNRLLTAPEIAVLAAGSTYPFN